MALEAPHGLSFGDDDDIFICAGFSFSQDFCCGCFPGDLPSRSWIIPSIPAILDTRVTRLAALKEASLRRKSPVGRSMTKAGASGEDGEVKMYESPAILTLMSRYGRIVTLGPIRKEI